MEHPLNRQGVMNSSLIAQEIKSKAIRGGSLLLFRYVFSFGINFSGTVILARILGPKTWGVFGISIFAYLMIQNIVDLGTVFYIIRQEQEPSDKELGTIFVLQQGIGLLSILVAFILGLKFEAGMPSPVIKYFLLSAAMGGYLQAWRSIPLGFLERRMEYAKVGTIEIMEAVGFNGVAVLLVLNHQPLWSLMLANILRGLLPAAIANILSAHRYHVLFNKDRFLHFLKYGMSFWLFQTLVWVDAAAAPILVTAIAGPEAYGFINLSYSILTYPQAFTMLFGRISFNIFSRFREDPDLLNRSISRILFLFMAIIIPLTTMISALSPWWMILVYGKEWKNVIFIMLLAALPKILWNIGYIISISLFAKRGPAPILKFIALYILMEWAFGYFLIHQFKFLGHPLAWLLANLSLVYLYRQILDACGALHVKIIYFVWWLLAMVIAWILAYYQHWYFSLLFYAVFIPIWIISNDPIKREIKGIVVALH
jgi:PST family polysaccharide transporter